MRNIFAAFMFTMFATPAMAGFQGPTAGEPVTTVRDALTAKWNDTKACMEGTIVNRVTTGSEKYTFKDSTGSITVEIDDKTFSGVHVTPSTKVRICGEVDRAYLKNNDFDVKHIEIIAQ